MVVLASRCGEAGGDGVQLAVVRALLTVVTAEHFVVHGDCLMQARLSFEGFKCAVFAHCSGA